MKKLFTSVMAALCLAAPVGTLSAQQTQLTEAQKEALRKFQEAMGEVPAADTADAGAPKPEHEKNEKHEKHEKHERKGFFGGKKKK